MPLSKIQKQILDEISQRMESGEAFSLRDIADVFNFSRPNILYHLKELEKAGYLVRDASGKVARVNIQDTENAVALLPLLAKVPCGEPLENVVEQNTTRMIPVPLYLLGGNSKKDLFLVKADGDSMSPKIEDGDYIVFEPNPSPRVGDVVVARLKSGFTVKLYAETEKQKLLRPLNPKYNPFVFNKSEEGVMFNVDGVAVGVFKSKSNLREGSMNENQ